MLLYNKSYSVRKAVYFTINGATFEKKIDFWVEQQS